MEYGERVMNKDIRVIKFQSNEDDRGSLVVIEDTKEIPFDPKRIFYSYGVSGDKSRANHANINSEFVMVAVVGSVTVDVFDGYEKTTYVLDDPKEGLYIPNLTWKSMYNFSPDAVIMVIASTLYDRNEYINDYDEFVGYVKKRVKK